MVRHLNSKRLGLAGQFVWRPTALGLALGLIMSGSCAVAKPDPCSSDQHRQWDFWLGKWRVTDLAGALQGTNTITRGPLGCGIVEHWVGAQGNEGMSLNGYDAARKTWTQFWVSPGVVIRLEGRIEQGVMQMEGTISYNATGLQHPFRGVWTPLPDGTVKQEFFERDETKWNVWFTGIYQRTI